MDTTAEVLLRDLENSPTDLKKLVMSALWRDRNAIAIESDAIARWERDDPRRWALVRDWLLSQGITITVLSGRPATVSSHAAPSASSPQPPPGRVQG